MALHTTPLGVTQTANAMLYLKLYNCPMSLRHSIFSNLLHPRGLATKCKTTDTLVTKYRQIRWVSPIWWGTRRQQWMVETPLCDSSNDQKHNICVCSCMNELIPMQVYVYVLVHITYIWTWQPETTLGTIYLLFWRQGLSHWPGPR